MSFRKIPQLSSCCLHSLITQHRQEKVSYAVGNSLQISTSRKFWHCKWFKCKVSLTVGENKGMPPKKDFFHISLTTENAGILLRLSYIVVVW